MPNKGYSWKQHAYNLSDGTPMIQFCRENDVRYCTVLKYIRKLGNVDEACAIAMKRRMKKDNNVRYYIEGKSLRAYCREKGLSYYKMWRKMRNGKVNDF